MSCVKWRSVDEPVSTKDVYEAAKEIGVKFPRINSCYIRGDIWTVI
ncbi:MULTISPECIES: hypothetical protein [Bacillus]|nr:MULTISPECIES: hypothetical protein [Bacillus]